MEIPKCYFIPTIEMCVFVCVYIAMSRVISVSKGRSERKTGIQPDIEKKRERAFQVDYKILRERESICQVECNHSGIII